MNMMNILLIVAINRKGRQGGCRASGFDLEGAAALHVPEGAAVEVGHHRLHSGLVGHRDDPQPHRAVWLQIFHIAVDTQTWC